MYPSRISSATHSLDPGPIGLLPIPAHPANSRCQTHIPLVHYFLGTPAAASVASRYPHSAPQNAPKTASFLCNLSPLDATLLSPLLCVANKELAQYLSPLNVTLTRNIGGRAAQIEILGTIRGSTRPRNLSPQRLSLCTLREKELSSG